MPRFLLKTFLFLALPLAVLEIAIRVLLPGPFRGLDHLLDVYEAVELIAEHRGLDVLFVGTSRVGASVRPDVFAARLQEARPELEQATVYRAWSGYSTLALHTLGLQNVLREQPDALRGCVVFVEAPAGLAEPQTWQSRWARAEWPELLGPTLHAGNLPRYWTEAGDGLQTKTVATLASASYAVRFATQVRGKVLRTLGAAAERIEGVRAPVGDLLGERGIRTDSAGVAATRALLGQEVRAWTRTDTPRAPIDWETSVLADLTRLVRDAGGEVVLFRIPFSPSAERVFAEAPVLAEDTATLHRWAEAQGVAYLDAGFAYTDDDFPDLAHLSASRAPAFTEKLAEAYLTWLAERHSE